MDSESESINLVSSDGIYSRPQYKQTAAHESVRDFDSLNNLVFSESEPESCANDVKIDSARRDNADNCIFGKKKSKGKPSFRKLYMQSDNNMNTIDCRMNSKLRFKDELNQHRHRVDDGIKEGSRASEHNYRMNSKKSIWKSFLALCIGLLFAFISFMPLRNIQTSLYPRRHLGNVSLACMYGSFAIGCLFSSWITQNVRPKCVIIIALIGHVIYCVVNIYPSFYTLIPGSCLFGFFHAPMWTTQEMMLASYAASYTAISHVNIDKAIQQFQSVFLVFCHAAQVFGNLMESLILQRGDDENKPINISLYHAKLESDLYDNEMMITNISHEVDNYKQLVWIGPFGYNVQANMEITHDKLNYENIIKYVFVAFAVMGLIVICLFLSKPDIIILKKKSSLCRRMGDASRFLATGTFMSLFLLMLFSGMQQAVVIGNVTKLYGSLVVGVSRIGYMMMCYGTCQLVVLLVMEKVHNHLRTSVAIFNAFLVSLGLLVWLYIWEPTADNLLKILGYVGLWGAVDGLWQSQVQNVLLAWSAGQKDAAVTVFRTVQSLGLVFVFVLDLYVTLLTLISICSAILVVGVIFYLILEVIRSPNGSHDPPPYML